MILVVDWFDGLKGIGEAISEDGLKVFLNHSYMQANGGFAGLATGDVLIAEIARGECGSHFASGFQRVDNRFNIKGLDSMTLLKINEMLRDLDSQSKEVVESEVKSRGLLE